MERITGLACPPKECPQTRCGPDLPAPAQTAHEASSLFWEGQSSARFNTRLGGEDSPDLCLLGSLTLQPSAPSRVSEGLQATTSLGVVSTWTPHGWKAPRKSPREAA